MKLGKLSLLFVAALAAQACGSDGVDGATGATGNDGPPGAPGAGGTDSASLTLITPNKGIIDRVVEVSIGGDGTTFAEGVKPSFGQGIEVLEATASTTSLLTVKLRISKDAQVGPRTVTVGDLKAEDAFTVIPAIDVLAEGGKATVDQGGLVQFSIENNDTRAFDPDAFQLEAGDLLDLGSQATGPNAATGFMLAPPLSKPGGNQIVVSNLDASGKPRVSFFSTSDALTVKARQASPLALNTPADQTFQGGLTKLLKVTTAANETAIVDYRIEIAADSTTVPVAFVFGTGGTKDDRLGQVLPPQNPFTGEFTPPPYDLHVALPIVAGAAAIDHYVILADLNGDPGSKAKVTASRAAATAAKESSIAHGPDAPQLVGAIADGSGQIVSATLADAAEIDAYRFSVEADAKLQLTVSTDADLEIILTKDPTVFEDAEDTPPEDLKVLAYLYPGKHLAAQRTLASAVGSTEIYAVVLSDIQGVVKTGKYTLGVRSVP